MTPEELRERCAQMGITVTAFGYIKTLDAARLLNMSRRTLEGWRLEGAGPPFKVLNRSVWYQLTDIAAWVETSFQGPAP